MAELEIITGYRGVPHITSRQDQGVNRSIFGPGAYILRDDDYEFPYDDQEYSENGSLPASIVGNTTVHIGRGVISFQGCIANCNGVDLTFENGTAYKYRQDLIVARYTKDGGTGIESVTLEVIKGTESTNPNPPAPGYVNERITQVPEYVPYVEIPFFAVYFEGTSISEVKRVAREMPNATRIKDNSLYIEAFKDIWNKTTLEPTKDRNIGPVTIPSSTSYNTIGTFDIEPGLHLLFATAYFSAAGAAGTRVLGLADAPPSGGTMTRDRAVTLPSIDTGVYGQVIWLYKNTIRKTIYVVARQNSGYNIDVSAATGTIDIPIHVLQ